MVPLSVVACAALFSLAAATDVQQCEGMSVPELSEKVQLTPCRKPPCKLKKGSDEAITVEFVPEFDEPLVKNSVWAEVLGVPLPFVGVDDVSICDKIYDEDDKKVSCPLKAGTKYKYKDSFHIYDFYPVLPRVPIKWSITNGKGRTLICFNVLAKIVA